jgi:sigma-B regulation protein RsbU (phosphoserine phosphatase)
MSVYCDETGGDYYDFIDKPDVSEGDVAVVLGDVAGHGAASALLMASARAYLRQRLAMPGDLAGAITDVNRSLAVDVRETGGFMTLFCAVVDAGDHRICWVRAGHDPALCYCAKDRSLSELAGSGLALGLDESFEYESQSRTFHPGDTVLIGTDGIWEAHDPMGRMFGKERLKRLFLDLVHLSAEEIVSEIVRTVNDYRDVEPQEDDVTLVVIKFPDGGEST